MEKLAKILDTLSSCFLLGLFAFAFVGFLGAFFYIPIRVIATGDYWDLLGFVTACCLMWVLFRRMTSGPY